MSLRTKAAAVVVTLAWAALGAGPLAALEVATRITPADASASDRFGSGVALEGDEMLVGAPGRDDFGGGAGLVFAYRNTGVSWDVEQKVIGDGVKAFHGFGSCVARQGAVMAVGAIGDDSAGHDSGAAYIFHRKAGQWVQELRILGPTQSRVLFGCGLALDGDTLIVGAPEEDLGGIRNVGAAYVYRFVGDEWRFEQKLTPGDRSIFGRFGAAIDLDGDRAVIGAEQSGNRGAAYVFERTGTSWIEVQKLTAAGSNSGNRFGQAVLVDGERLVIGAPSEATFDCVGSAHVFERIGGAWVEVQELPASDGVCRDRSYGRGIDVRGDTLLIGAALQRPEPAVYVFRKRGAGWVETQKVVPGFGNSRGFGRDISLWGERVAVGARDALNSGGAVFVLDPEQFCQDLRTIDGGCPESDATTTRLTRDGGGPEERFGASAAISGEFAVVGVPDGPGAEFGTGSVSVLERNGVDWSHVRHLTAADGQGNDQFGASVSMDGDVVAVGAWGDDDMGFEAGSAYVFRRTVAGWAQEQKLLAADGGPFDRFGWSVAVSGDRLAVGQLNDDDLGSDAGAVYVYAYNGASWVLEGKIASAFGDADDHFGVSVSMSGDRLAVGASGDEVSGSASGSVSLFGRSGGSWSGEQVLTASDGAAGDRFGSFVALDGTTLLVGAPFDDHSPQTVDAGSAYLFELGGSVWREDEKLRPVDEERGSQFGYRVALDGDLALIAAPRDDDGGTLSGAATLFRREAAGWMEVSRLTLPDAQPGDVFGSAVAVRQAPRGAGPPTADAGDDRTLECGPTPMTITPLDGLGSRSAGGGDTILVGVRGDDEAGTDSGSILIQETQNLVWSWDSPAAIVDDPSCSGPLARLPEGVTPVTLTVFDNGMSDSDTVLITVRDTSPPTGHIHRPVAGSCLGQADVPVRIKDNFEDCCDAGLLREYDPGGPEYTEHGDFDITVTATDRAGFTTSDSTSFRIDLVPPAAVLLAAPESAPGVPPEEVPFSEGIQSDDDEDGVQGGVVREVVLWDGCVVFDGASYGNRDGRLGDETLFLDQSSSGLLCRALILCGDFQWENPVLRYEALDCGGNVGFDERIIDGEFSVTSGVCD